MLQLYMLFPIF